MKPHKTVRSPKPFKHSWQPRSHSAFHLRRHVTLTGDPETELKWARSGPTASRLDPGGTTRKLNPEAANRLFDEAYLSALRDRNREVETHLINALSRPLWVKLHSRLRSPQLIEDARQETFLRVFVYFRSGKTLEKPASLPGFVLAVCNNVCHELLRSHTRYEQMQAQEGEPLDEGASPEQRVVTEERKRLVTEILDHLSTKDRQVLKRVFFDEADKDEICHELGIHRDYLRLLVHRAKLRLKAALQGVGLAA